MKEGRTVLYTPLECLQFSPEEASKDKQLVERMESKPESSVTFVQNNIQTEALPFCLITFHLHHSNLFVFTFPIIFLFFFFFWQFLFLCDI